MPVKANDGDGEKSQRQANGSPSVMDETVCDGLPPLLKVPKGIVETAIDADGVVGHEGSTVLVCLNGLRLLAFCTDGTSDRSNPRI